MATVREIVTRAARRIRQVGLDTDLPAEEAVLARDVLNGMMASWPAYGIEPLWSDLGLNDTFAFWVPPAALTSETITDVVYQGTWDADTNWPMLAGGTGTRGTVYKVSVAGTTSLDGLASWSVGDYLVFNGTQWLAALGSRRLERAVIDLLALELCAEFGKEPGAVLAKAAGDGMDVVQAAYIKAPLATFDRALRRIKAGDGVPVGEQTDPTTGLPYDDFLTVD